MSLNFFEKKGTIAESKQNFKRAKVDVQTAAIELDTSDENIKNILVLNNVRPEDPWILKEYIHEKTKQNG
ncbi:MAG: DUF2316 family protein, partial [Liquorilactobacillus hordei]|uniref:DUF2316 family protein n=1 Tax=Liquorilactobacillus hordei TaxID=468911 RepID=UPI0039E870D0